LANVGIKHEDKSNLTQFFLISNQYFQEMFSFCEINISLATVDVGCVMKCRGTIRNKSSWGR